jgi:hypothetical protein
MLRVLASNFPPEAVSSHVEARWQNSRVRSRTPFQLA